MPQHEVAKGNGHIEFFLANPITLSKVVAKIPGAVYPSGGSDLLYLGVSFCILLVQNTEEY
jgi:hypothetical protein